ncbi:3-oxoacyl-[acyl-carrier protein] reductase [Blastococcus colisei]|uniref:3-oxoacyl-[acyl-carrier protein] reductase n=1 Tax=Blastococcus colisei TaxID=1564162 RepID=A0A543PFB0_9ACTN|nr:SDR family oxidoreductase [Blastococcus colisei]TQN42760.1 3-oxoacyl-[acyl-carrier protein] reductase [Blastococcus colisei]
MVADGVVLVLGGSSGIGAALVRRLAAGGRSVVFTHRTGAERAADLVAELGGRVRTVPCDVRRPEDLTAAFDAAGETLTGVVHCAGAWTYTRLDELTLDELDDSWALNARSVALTLQEAGRRLSDGGSVVVVSSVAAELAPARQTSYVMGKAAAEAAVRVAAKELGRQGIRVNAVRAGATDTPQLRATTGEAAIEAMAKAPALRRLGDPDDVAAVITFLLGADAGWMTGTVVEATGGLR